MGIQKLIDAAETFCKRVEAGEIRSTRSYAEFKAALDDVCDGCEGNCIRCTIDGSPGRPDNTSEGKD